MVDGSRWRACVAVPMVLGIHYLSSPAARYGFVESSLVRMPSTRPRMAGEGWVRRRDSKRWRSPCAAAIGRDERVQRAKRLSIVSGHTTVGRLKGSRSGFCEVDIERRTSNVKTIQDRMLIPALSRGGISMGPQPRCCERGSDAYGALGLATVCDFAESPPFDVGGCQRGVAKIGRKSCSCVSAERNGIRCAAPVRNATICAAKVLSGTGADSLSSMLGYNGSSGVLGWSLAAFVQDKLRDANG